MKQYPFFPTKTKSVATCSYNQLIPSKPSFGKSFSALLLVRLPVTLLALGGAVAHRLATATPQGDQSPNFGTSATGSPVMKKNHNWHVEHPKILSIGTYWNHWIFKVHRGWSTFQSPQAFGPVFTRWLIRTWSFAFAASADRARKPRPGGRVSPTLTTSC